MRQLIERLDAAVAGRPLDEGWRAGASWERGYLAQALEAFVRDVADALEAFLEEHGYDVPQAQAKGGQAWVTFAPSTSGARSRRPEEVEARPGKVSVAMNYEGVLTATVEKDRRFLTNSPGPKPVRNRSASDVAMEILMAVADDLGTHF